MNQIPGLFGKKFEYLEAALQAREKLQLIHSANIANADTPNYRADTRSFSAILSRSRPAQTPPLATTHPNHIASGQSGRIADTGSKDGSLQIGMDGNTVDLQEEMAAMTENQLQYNLTIRLLQGKMHGLLTAIRGGSQ